MRFASFFKSILVGLPVGITFIDVVGYVARVDGISMQPVLNPDNTTTDYVFLNRWAVRSQEIKRGEIYSLVSPRDPDLKIIKRVVGLQGDLIVSSRYAGAVVRIPEGHCWVEGDHTGHSMDSNSFGPVSLGLVIAKASYIVWPPSRWQSLKSFIPESRVPLNISANIAAAISLVDRIEFDFMGNVLRKGITLGDVDNDGNNELIVGSDNGEVAIFKGKERWQTLSGLNFVSCVAVGDILNQNKNFLVIITGDGWCHIYSCITQVVNVSVKSDGSTEDKTEESVDQVDGATFSNESVDSEKSTSSDSAANSTISKEKIVLQRIHVQRIPANTKDILLGDIDGDGLIEMVLGLTDRVVRSYRWFSNPDASDTFAGKLVGLSKWECAKQIGSVTLHHSKDGLPSLLVAQPGGTFMRIVCQPDEVIAQSMEAAGHYSDSGSSQSENLIGSKIDYQFLGISRMRNQNISTEIVGNLKTKTYDEQQSLESDGSDVVSTNSSSSYGIKNLMKTTKTKENGNPYALATLDGTIMLVQNEIILWAMAVDHQIFALTKLDVTGNGSDDIVACSWDGQTYILDQNKNSVRFHLDESVQAFECGYYNLSVDSLPIACFVYVTFRNKIYLYYNIPLKVMICKKFDPDISNIKEIIKDEHADEENFDRKMKKQLVEYVLYGLRS